MKKQLFTALLIFSANAFADSATDFDFYKSIPEYESITLSGQEISIIIKSDYTISLSAHSRPDSYTSAELTGSGIVIWDAKENRLSLQLKGTISGSYSRSEDIYVTKTKADVGGIILNGLFGSGTANSTRKERVFDHTEYYNASGTESFTVTIPMQVTDDGKYVINSKTISATLTGSTTKNVYFSLNNDANNLKYGSKRTRASSNKDEFGSWQWTKDRSKIFLCSTNIQSDTLTIIKDSIDSVLKLSISFHDEIEGLSSTTTDDGGELVQLEFSIDETNVTLLFYNNENGIYLYGTYNRFLEKWNWDATSLIEQLSDKQTIIVSYKKDGENYSAIFELEGLETLLSYFR